MAEVERLSLALYRFAAEHARGRGIIIADTKFEFGLDGDGRLVLGDEALTPDSSRFWPADEYAPGGPQPSFDKQFVRDFCEQTGWNKTHPGPELPPAVVAGTRARYVEAFERLTGIAFEAYLADPPGRARMSREVESFRRFIFSTIQDLFSGRGGPVVSWHHEQVGVASAPGTGLIWDRCQRLPP